MLPAPRLVRSAIALLRVVPVGPVRRTARVCGWLGYWFAPGRRAVIRANLRHLAPGLSHREHGRLARRTFANLFDSAVDLWRLPSAPLQEVTGQALVVGREHFDAALALGRGVVVVTGHLGPYELGGATLAALGFPVHAMVEDLDAETSEALATYRRATGMQVISRSRGLRAAYRLLREGQMVLLVADRMVGEGSEGTVVPFGAGERTIPTGPAAFAIATGAPVVVGFIVRNPAAPPRYLVRVEPPILPPDPSGDVGADRLRLTREIGSRLAAAAIAHPDQWFVFQPEWIERDGGA